MKKNVYGFDDDGKKIKIGEYDDGLLPVGGRIFYIDSNSDETVKFYDTQGVELESVEVGDTPSYYKVTNVGTSGKDKYYVYKSYAEASKRWTYKDSNNTWVYENLGTSTAIGTGKTNTSTLLAANSGAYASTSVTVWYVINNARNNNMDGCDDWFLGSKDETEQYRLFLVNNPSYGTFTGPWTSSEYDDTNAYAYANGAWQTNAQKNTNKGLTYFRAF